MKTYLSKGLDKVEKRTYEVKNLFKKYLYPLSSILFEYAYTYLIIRLLTHWLNFIDLDLGSYRKLRIHSFISIYYLDGFDLFSHTSDN